AAVSALHATDRGTVGTRAAAGGEARAFWILPDPPRDPSTGACRRRGCARAPEPRAAGTRARILGWLCDLLPDRPVAHRPDREQSLPGPLGAPPGAAERAAVAAPSGTYGADRRFSAPHLAACRQNGYLLSAADRARAAGAIGDGGPGADAVGQGLGRRRAHDQDRFPRTGHAFRRGRDTGTDRRAPRQARRPLAHRLQGQAR